MLVISGTAQYQLDEGQYSKGNWHTFTLFSVNENFDAILDDVEAHLNELGWDDIFIGQAELIADDTQLDHSILKQGFEKALSQGMSVVMNNEAITSVA